MAYAAFSDLETVWEVFEICTIAVFVEQLVSPGFHKYFSFFLRISAVVSHSSENSEISVKQNRY